MMKKMIFYRYLFYSIEILVLFVLGTTPNLFPEFFGSKACLLVSVAIAISVFEHELPSMFFGLACGVLTDLGYSNSIGTFAIGLTIICFILGFCANNFITTNFYNVMLASILIIAALISLHFLFYYVFAGYENAGVYYVNHYISRIVQTFIFTIPIYFMNRFVYTTLCDEK